MPTNTSQDIPHGFDPPAPIEGDDNLTDSLTAYVTVTEAERIIQLNKEPIMRVSSWQKVL